MSGLDSSFDSLNLAQKREHKSRSAAGVGIPSIVTILVVLMLTSFAVLSLVSARADLQLSHMAVESAQNYYKADSQAVEWYAELCDALETKAIQASAASLERAGYTVTNTKESGLRVSSKFAIDLNRELVATVKIDTSGKPKIIQWQVIVAY